MKIVMTHDKTNLFDASGRSVLTAAYQDRRIAELELENERLKRIIIARQPRKAPAEPPVVKH